ncbi:hypothetical protein FPSE_12040 [Fusarium pseudograminearum CS3096]|uniref:Uncharacterized protein n=1 Tax=Fusarium pseudograminearum (strain CS3096) TaxID=1028729 RepID=K3V7J5_FUSPC|nr:hypothetical protein FPSE_12040 [Fusarium pseudograminearum CS3096]EKJ67768.1 hypothetical protein FPSE_12040 [Fusarium pseudograminearum CS3096]
MLLSRRSRLVIGEYLPDEPSGFDARGATLKQPNVFDPETDNFHLTQERSAILIAMIKNKQTNVYRPVYELPRWALDRWLYGRTLHHKFYFYSEFLENVTDGVTDKKVRYNTITNTIKAKVDEIFAARQ